MQTRIWVAALLVLTGAALPARAQTTLEWKFREGDKFYVEEITDQNQNISVAGMEIKMRTKMTNITSYTVKSTFNDAATLEMKIESVEAKSEGNQFGGGMEKMQEKLQGATFTVTLKAGKITKFEGTDAFIKKLTDDDEKVAMFVKMIFTEDLLKKTPEMLFATLPTRAVKKGEAWKLDQNIPLGPVGTLKAKNQYTYKGTESDGELVTYKGTMTWAAPKDAGDNAKFKIIKGDFKSDDGRGSLLFDAAAGRLVRGTNSMTVRGSMTMEFGGNEIEMAMTMDATTTTRVLTKNPKAN